MRNYIKHIDDFFREKLGNYTETPPPDVWDDLEGRLDTLKPRVSNPSYRRLGHVAIVSLILILGISLTRRITNTDGNGTNNLALNNASNTVTPASPAIANAANVTPDQKTAAPNSSNDKTGNNSKPGNSANEINNNQTPPTATTNVTGTKNPAERRTNTNKTGPGKNKQQTGKTAAKNTGNQKAGKTVAGNSQRGSAHGPNSEEAQPENEYSSGTSDRSARDIAGNGNSTKTPVKQPEELAAATKKATPPAVKTTLPKNELAKKSPKSNFTRFEAGVKVGYERGANDAMASKAVISPYLQYNLSPKVSIMVQPAAKYANLPKKDIANKSYYQVNDDGIVNQNGDPVPGTAVGGTVPFTYNYIATQSHDSIVKSYHYGGSYMEFELPILLKYKLSKKLSAYGGVSMVYSQMTNITESSYSVNGIQRTATASITTTTPPPTPPAVGDMITYNGTQLKNYTGALYTAPQQGVLRLGYTLGFSYEYSKKWLFDAITQISPVKPITKGDYNISTPLSSPYFRLSVGYKLK